MNARGELRIHATSVGALALPTYKYHRRVNAGRKRFERRAKSELLCIARLKIHHGKLDEFKHLAARCVELVRTKDTRTLQYELYFNSDNTECLVFERYRDSQALLDHHKNLGDTMAAILRTCSGSGEICGTPSPETD
jgi:quinol monooxygenase YgiN